MNTDIPRSGPPDRQAAGPPGPDRHGPCRWGPHARRLATQLVDGGHLTCPHWIRAVQDVPRHLLVALTTRAEKLTERELTALYTDTTLLTDPRPWWWQPPQPPFLVQAAPSVLAAALELTDPADQLPDPAGQPGQPGQPGQHGPDRTPGGPVLIVSSGAGGYLAGLACAALGDRRVVVAENEPGRADTIRGALGEVGYAPQIVSGPPGPATAESGPYDAVLMIETRDGRQSGTARMRGIGQVAEGGRMILGPDPARPGPRSLLVLDRTTAGIRPHEKVIDRVVEPAVLAFLTGRPGLLAELRSTHVPGPDGRCRGCADAGHARTAPCEISRAAATATGPDGPA